LDHQTHSLTNLAKNKKWLISWKHRLPTSVTAAMWTHPVTRQEMHGLTMKDPSLERESFSPVYDMNTVVASAAIIDNPILPVPQR
jgi:hypothetical protein